jgi:hypothetical protein
MNNLLTNIVRPTFFATALLAALALTACGGGDSGGDALPAGKVGTVGDGVNAAEFEAIQCGMNKDQVFAIVGDAPSQSYNNGEGFGWTLTDPYVVVYFKNTGVLREKISAKKGQANPLTQIAC